MPKNLGSKVIVAWRLEEWQKRAASKSGELIEVLNLSTTVYNRLKYASIDTVEDLTDFSSKDLAEIKGIGKTRAQLIVKALQLKGIQVKE